MRGGKTSAGRTSGRPPRLPVNVRKHAHVLCVLAKAKPKVVKYILANSDKSLLRAISECSYNVLRGRVALTSSQKQRLNRYKTALRTLTQKRTSLVRKRALSQKGGFLGTLLGAVAPLLIQTIGGLIAAKSRRKRRRRRR